MHTTPSTRSRRTAWLNLTVLALGALCTLGALPACATPLPAGAQMDMAGSDDALLGGVRSDQIVFPPESQARLDANDNGPTDSLYEPEFSWLDSLPVVPESHRGHVYLIRHAEKKRGVDLSHDGERRSLCLTDLFTSARTNAFEPSNTTTFLQDEQQEENQDVETEGRKKHKKHKKLRTYRDDSLSVSGLIAQQFKLDGRRSRPYETLVPLAKKLHLPIHHQCDRDDAPCVRRVAERFVSKGQNVLISWQHSAMTDIAAQLGIKRLFNPPRRYDIVFDLKGHKVHSITSQECVKLDEDYIDWHGSKSHFTKDFSLVPDDAWAD